MANDTPSPDDAREPAQDSRWLFPVLLALVLAGILVAPRFSGPDSPPGPSEKSQVSPWTPAPLPEGETVRLEIDFGNGARRVFSALPWRENMTVADVMTEARKFRPGIRFAQVGTGAGGFLTELEGLENEGSGGRNWLFDVAGQPATKSFCLQTAGSGELVLWRFAHEDKEQ